MMSICLIPGDINLEHLVKVRYQAELVDPKRSTSLSPEPVNTTLLGEGGAICRCNYVKDLAKGGHPKLSRRVLNPVTHVLMRDTQTRGHGGEGDTEMKVKLCSHKPQIAWCRHKL